MGFSVDCDINIKLGAWGGLFKRKYWYTPQPDILERGNTERTEIIAPDYIADILAQVDMPCISAGYTAGAQIVTYHFNLISLKDHNKANRAVKALSAALKHHVP